MATLADWSGGQVIKMLYVGDAAMGKTGSLVSLVKAGYNLRILDFDKGLKILQNLLKEQDKTLLEKVNVESFTDEYKNIGGRITCTKAVAWQKAMTFMADWKPYGPLETWGLKDVFVLDSLTKAGRSALNFILMLNGRLGQRPYQSDYMEAQALIENFCELVCSETVKTNVIIITHLRELSKMESKTNSKGDPIQVPVPGTEKLFPETGTGRALSPQIGRLFNSILHCELNYGQRKINTVPPAHSTLALKSAGGSAIPATYPLATGLADYFKAVQGV